MTVRIAELEVADWPAVRSIHEEGIATGQATFETRTVAWDDWDRSHLRCCRFVARQGDRTIGWAALSPVSERCVYGGVAEVSVYVSEGQRGGGVGRALLTALIQASERAGIWTLQAGVFPENEASIRLHRSGGFRQVGIRERLGQLGDTWKDVILMERRSRSVG